MKTDNELKYSANALLAAMHVGHEYPNAAGIVAELLRRWAEAKSIAAESEAARLGAVTMANGLREDNDQLRRRLSECEELLEQARTEASELRCEINRRELENDRLLREARTEASALRDDLAAAIEDAGVFELHRFCNGDWVARRMNDPQIAIGPDIHTAAAAIRAAIAPKPPTPHEVAEAWHRISNCINGISREDRLVMRAAVEAFVGEDGAE